MKSLMTLAIVLISLTAFASPEWSDLKTDEQQQIKDAAYKEFLDCAVWSGFVSGFQAVNTVSQVAYPESEYRSDSLTIYVTRLTGNSNPDAPATVISERYSDGGKISFTILNVFIPSDVCEPQG